MYMIPYTYEAIDENDLAYLAEGPDEFDLDQFDDNDF